MYVDFNKNRCFEVREDALTTTKAMWNELCFNKGTHDVCTVTLKRYCLIDQALLQQL
jgi:hypothetical protein